MAPSVTRTLARRCLVLSVAALATAGARCGGQTASLPESPAATLQLPLRAVFDGVLPCDHDECPATRAELSIFSDGADDWAGGRFLMRESYLRPRRRQGVGLRRPRAQSHARTRDRQRVSVRAARRRRTLPVLSGRQRPSVVFSRRESSRARPDGAALVSPARLRPGLPRRQGLRGSLSGAFVSADA